MKGFVVEIPGKKYDWIAMDKNTNVQAGYTRNFYKEEGLKYLSNLNLFHGYDEIYFPKRLEDEIPQEYKQLEFIRFFPDSLLKYGFMRMNRLIDILTDLVNLNRYSLQANFSAHLRLYLYWSVANELEAALIFPRFGIPLQGASQILSDRISPNESNESICNAIATWLFTHIPDSVSPVIHYNKMIPQKLLYKEILESKPRKELSSLREKATAIFQKGRDIYKDITTDLPKINSRLQNFLQTNFKSIGTTFSSISIACITENYLTLLPTVFTVPELLKEFQKVISRKEFDSVFNYEPFFDDLPDFKIFPMSGNIQKIEVDGYNSKNSILMSRGNYNFGFRLQSKVNGFQRGDMEDIKFPYALLDKHEFLRQHPQINDDYESVYK